MLKYPHLLISAGVNTMDKSNGAVPAKVLGTYPQTQLESVFNILAQDLMRKVHAKSAVITDYTNFTFDLHYVKADVTFTDGRTVSYWIFILSSGISSIIGQAVEVSTFETINQPRGYINLKAELVWKIADEQPQ